MYGVEYLIIVNKDNTNSIRSLKSLIQSDDEIVITNDTIKFSQLKFGFQISQGNLATGNKEPYFHLKLNCENEEDIVIFSQLLRRVRGRLVMLVDKNIFTLWDDLSRFYSKQAYDKIHRVENLMRKLLSKFMLVNIGTAWTQKRLPNDLIKSTRSDNDDENFLNNVDFIKLSDFLFSENYPSHKDNLIKELNKAKDLSSFSIEELKSLLPQSNWSKYFAEIIDCSDDYLRKKWKELYELRNSVAHNKSFTINDLNRVERVSSEVSGYLTDAISKLEEIVIPEEEVETVVENIAGERNSEIGKFIDSYRQLENVLQLINRQQDYFKKIENPKIYTLPRIASELVNISVIPKEFADSLNRLSKIRNTVVHGANLDFQMQELDNLTEEIQLRLEQATRILKVEESDHLERIKSEKIIKIYKKLRDEILKLEGIEMKINKHYISFVHDKNIADVRVQQKSIKVWINLHIGELNDPKNIAKDVSKIGHLGNGDYEINLDTEKDVEYVMSLIIQSYKNND